MLRGEIATESRWLRLLFYLNRDKWWGLLGAKKKMISRQIWKKKCLKCIKRKWKGQKKKFRCYCYRVTLFSRIAYSFRPHWRFSSATLSSDFWTLVKCTVSFISHQPPALLPEAMEAWALTQYVQTVLTSNKIDVILLRPVCQHYSDKINHQTEKGSRSLT